MKRSGFLVATLLVAVTFTGCTGGDPGDGSPSPPETPSASPPAGDGTGGGAAAPPEPSEPPASPGQSGVGPAWTTGPLAVTHDVPVPPVPQLFRIRSAAHPDEGFDRIVFDFHGALPGYTVRYVDEVHQDPSDLPVALPGRRFLLVTFTPAQAHTDAGQSLISPVSRSLDYPMMRGYVLVGDFEGYVSVAVGLDDVVGFRVGELPGEPGRIYLDVAA